MSSNAFHTQHIQRRVVRTVLMVGVILALVGIPLLMFDELRLEIAHQLELAPGKGAEQLADGDSGAVLVVLPLGEYDGVGLERYAYDAAYIGRPSEAGMTLTDIETEEEIDIPLEGFPFIAADSDGEHLLFRGPAAGEEDVERSVLLTRDDASIEILPAGQETPDLPGDWETPIWDKVVGTCDRVSPHKRFIACFNRAEVVNYLAGEWQVDVQLFGDFKVSEPVYRGIGFRPMLGFAHNDTWLYFQNETGVYRIEIPRSLQAQQPRATPTVAEHKP